MTLGSGDPVWTGDRRKLTLGTLLKSGGAGSVYLLRESPLQVAKIYHANVDHALYERKVAAMLRLSPELPDLVEGAQRHVQIAWPQALLRDGQGRFLGFLMPAVDVKATSELEVVLQERQARVARLPTGLGAKITLAANLSAVLAALHQQHHYVVDLKPVNLRFYPRSLYMAMLDCDGFSIQGQGERFPAPQFTPDYLAPEFQRTGITTAGEEQQDRFALSVVVFQLLNFGIHPFTGRPTSDRLPTDIPGRIAGRWYAYGQRANAALSPSPVSGHRAMPVELRHLFDRAFEGHAATRPSPNEWKSVLQAYATRANNRLVACRSNDEHQHYVALPCAACARDALIHKVQAAQRSVPAPRRGLRGGARAQPAARAARMRTPLPAAPRASFPPMRRPPAAPAAYTPWYARAWSRLSGFNRFRLVMFAVFLLYAGFHWLLGLFDGPQRDSVNMRYYPPPQQAAVAAQPALPQASAAERSTRANQVLDLLQPAPWIEQAARESALQQEPYAAHIGRLSAKASTREPPLADTRRAFQQALGQYLAAATDYGTNRHARIALLNALSQILAADPWADDVAFELGWMYLINSNRPDATRYFKHTLAVNPVHPAAWYGLGVAASDDAVMLGALALAEALQQSPAQAEEVRRRFQPPMLFELGIDRHRFEIIKARARRMALLHRGDAVPADIEALANQPLPQ